MDAFRNNVSLMRRFWEACKHMMLFPSPKPQVPTCACGFRASDITTRWQCSMCFVFKENKQTTKKELDNWNWDDLQKCRKLNMKREIKLPDFPFSDAGKCLTLPYCSLSASKGTTALPFLIIRVLLTPPPHRHPPPPFFGSRPRVSPCSLLGTHDCRAAVVNVCLWTWCHREIRDGKFHL